MKRTGRCDKCGFDWQNDHASIVMSIATAGARFTDALAGFDDVGVRTRPAPEVWSPLEYTAHTREALAFYDDRIRRVVAEDRPQLTAFSFAEAAERDAYNAEVVTFAIEGLTAAADRLAARLRELPDDRWQRTGVGSEGGDPRTVLDLARRAAHEVEHHLHDLATTF